MREFSFPRLARDRLSRRIVDHITEAILTGKMQPGDRLATEAELAEQFGVSRTAVREATQALRAQGLVEITPGRGTFVSQPDVASIIVSLQLMLRLENHSFDDLMVTRHFLELPTARLAARNASPRNIELLRACNDGMAESLQDPDTYMAHDAQFHVELAHATQNTVLSVLVQPLMMMLHACRAMIASVPGKAQRSLAAHQRICEAVAAGDEEGAVQAMRAHLEQVVRDADLTRELLSGHDSA